MYVSKLPEVSVIRWRKKMIKAYQHQFIRTMMIALSLILLIVLTLINILNFVQLYQKVNHKLIISLKMTVSFLTMMR